MAIKIFTNQQCFVNERRIYHTKHVASVLGTAPMFYNNHDRRACTPYGYIFPPYTISDEYKSLESVMRSGPVAFPTVMQACLPVVPVQIEKMQLFRTILWVSLREN